MVPKIRAALAALTWEDAEAIIADSGAPHALTRALDDPHVRHARLVDRPPCHHMRAAAAAATG